MGNLESWGARSGCADFAAVGASFGISPLTWAVMAATLTRSASLAVSSCEGGGEGASKTTWWRRTGQGVRTERGVGGVGLRAID